MAVNWTATARKARKAFKKDFPQGMTVTVNEQGSYDIATGKTPVVSTDYPTHGVVKAFEVADMAVVSPGEVEILFHSGEPPDSIPDLTKKNNIEITAYGTVYKVRTVRAVRPEAVTIMYKAIAKVSEDV
jgi:hypothetical protein